MKKKEGFVKRGKSFTIKTKIIVIMLTVIIGLSTLFGILSCMLNYQSSVDVLDQMMKELAKVTGERISSETNEAVNVLSSLGVTDLSDANTLENVKIQYGLKEIYQIDLDGYCSQIDKSISDETYFQQAKQGNSFISNAHKNLFTGEMSMVISAPIWENHVKDSKVIGVLAAIPDPLFVHEIIQNIHVGKSGGAYLLDQNGTILSDKDPSRIGTINMIEMAKTDPSKKVQAAIEEKMIQGENGIGKLISYKGTTELVAYAPVPNTNGWSIGIYATQNDFLGGVFSSIWITIVLVLIFILLGAFISIRFATSLSQPIVLCAKRLRLLAQGDISTAAPVIDRKDELQILADATSLIVHELTAIIQDQILVLGKMSEGVFTFHPSIDYKGDFAPLKESIEKILCSMNQTLQHIGSLSEQVAVTCSQVSDGSLILSDGAAKQADSIDSLSITLKQLAEKTDQNALDAQSANQQVLTIENEIQEGNKQMVLMSEAMKRIETITSQIEEIVHTIESFAKETDLLSLNAAIEAARAFEAGKGFAVVAQSIQELAVKSASAVKETTQLIQDTVNAVKEGGAFVEQLSLSMEHISEKVDLSTSLIQGIADSSVEQASTINEVSAEISSFSYVTQDNSAAAEESAASTQDMARQAKTLKSLLEQFIIEGEKNTRK